MNDVAVVGGVVFDSPLEEALDGDAGLDLLLDVFPLRRRRTYLMRFIKQTHIFRRSSVKLCIVGRDSGCVRGRSSKMPQRTM